jgi:acyl-CoA synthetase (NDP forming)
LRAAKSASAERAPAAADAGFDGNADFLTARRALVASNVPVVDAALAGSEEDAVAAQKHFGTPVAIKAEVAGLLHKSDVGCVRLGCAGPTDVADAYRHVIENARKAGFDDAIQVLIQPMVTGVAEAYAGIIADPMFGPAICFGLGGVFVEVISDVRTEMAPLTHDDAMGMILGIKAARILTGARGRPSADLDALADLLVHLGDFAVANAGRFQALDLNPIVVKARGEGVIAVDIAIEASHQDASSAIGKDSR